VLKGTPSFFLNKPALSRPTPLLEIQQRAALSCEKDALQVQPVESIASILEDQEFAGVGCKVNSCLQALKECDMIAANAERRLQINP